MRCSSQDSSETASAQLLGSCAQLKASRPLRCARLNLDFRAHAKTDNWTLNKPSRHVLKAQDGKWLGFRKHAFSRQGIFRANKCKLRLFNYKLAILCTF